MLASKARMKPLDISDILQSIFFAGLASSKPYSARYSAGKIDNSNFSVCRMTVSLVLIPICSPTKTLCRWWTLPMG